MKHLLIASAMMLMLAPAYAQQQPTTKPTTAATQPMAQRPPASLNCGSDPIVWVNTSTKVYHVEGDRYYGATKQGKFVCEKSATAEGDHRAKR